MADEKYKVICKSNGQTAQLGGEKNPGYDKEVAERMAEQMNKRAEALEIKERYEVATL